MSVWTAPSFRTHRNLVGCLYLYQNPELLCRGIDVMDWTHFSMQSFNYISAGEKQHFTDLPASWRPVDFHTKWKVCPLFASTWTCLFSKASDAATAASGSHRRVTAFKFLQTLRNAEKSHLWAPSPAQVFMCMELDH